MSRLWSFVLCACKLGVGKNLFLTGSSSEPFKLHHRAEKGIACKNALPGKTGSKGGSDDGFLVKAE